MAMWWAVSLMQKYKGTSKKCWFPPMSEISIVTGYLAGGIIRGIFVAAVVSLIALFFTQLNIQHPVLAILVIVMTAGVFSLAGLLNAIFAKKFDDIAVIPSFVLAPLTYLGGVFYTITLLPDFWQKVSYFNPILYMVNAMRFSVLGKSDIDIFTGILVILAFFIMLLCTAIYLLKKRSWDQGVNSKQIRKARQVSSHISLCTMIMARCLSPSAALPNGSNNPSPVVSNSLILCLDASSPNRLG